MKASRRVLNLGYLRGLATITQLHIENVRFNLSLVVHVEEISYGARRLHF